MSSDKPGDLPENPTEEQLRKDSEETRARIAESVEQLAAKADVKANVKADVSAAAQHAKDGAQEKVQEAQAKAHDAQQKVGAEARQVQQQFRGLSPLAQAALVVAPVIVVVLIIVRAIRASRG